MSPIEVKRKYSDEDEWRNTRLEKDDTLTFYQQNFGKARVEARGKKYGGEITAYNYRGKSHDKHGSMKVKRNESKTLFFNPANGWLKKADDARTKQKDEDIRFRVKGE